MRTGASEFSRSSDPDTTALAPKRRHPFTLRGRSSWSKGTKQKKRNVITSLSESRHGRYAYYRLTDP
ncbi:MAG: hypothetical protein J6O23_02115, partial [Prevotella sp.]|nr:hypothetical protein [Prevotella sp.]